MKTIKLTDAQARELSLMLGKIIPAGNMCNERRFSPNYDQVMVMIEIANQLIEPTNTIKS